MKDPSEQEIIKMKTEMRGEKCCVYRVQVGVRQYIGVTTNYQRRIQQHITDAYFHNSNGKLHKAMRESMIGFSAEILRRGTEEECYAMEKTLRPKANMELNEAPGGRAEEMINIPPSQNIYRIKKVSLKKPGELDKTFVRYSNTLIETDHGDYIDYDNQYEQWKRHEGKQVVAKLRDREPSGSANLWHWLELIRAL